MRKQLKRFGYIFCLLTALSNAALAGPVDDIVRDLKSRMGTIDKSFYTYSYTKNADVGVVLGETVDISDAKIQHFLSSKANEYFDLNTTVKSGTMPGLYLALDPIASREYGGDSPNWVLFRIQIPKGLRYLDVSMDRRGWAASKMPATVVSSLKNLGCEPNAMDAENFSYQHLFQYDEGSGCRKIVNQILNQLGVDMIKYRWTATEIPYCTWSEDFHFDQGAIILLRPEQIPLKAMRVFTADTPDTSEYRNEKRRLDELMQLENVPLNHRLWSTSKHRVNRDEFESWTQRHLLNCMPFPESAFSAIDQMPETATTKCPESLKTLKSDFLPWGFRDLCALYTRYQTALAAAKKKGLNPPERVAEVLGPRFINLPDWNKAKAKGKADPWTVYNPAPQTWASWDEARQIADQAAARNLKTGSVAPFTLDSIREIHTAGLKNLPHAGDYRTSHNSEIGMSFDRNSTIPFKQAQALQHIEYMNLKDPSKPLISWTPSTCKDEWPEDVKRDVFKPDGVRLDAVPKLTDLNKTFASANGTPMQCGYITYAPTSEVPGQLENWMDKINSTTETWGTDHPQGDPIMTAARAQRWFIAVHPFERGNGRTSRLIMDEILQSQGLPTPIFTDMNDDIGTPENEWAKKVGQGMLRTVQTLENCTRNPSQLGCQVVSAEPPI